MREKIYVSESSVGRGIFAKVGIKPRETIFYLTGRLIGFEEAVAAEHGENSIQIGLDLYVDPHSTARYPDSPARYLNHSCSPNAGFVDEIRLIALTEIRPGEEIRFDYSTTMLERYWELDCSCGSPLCRGSIRDFDLLPLPRQDFYIGLGIVPDYILRYLEAAPAIERRRVA